MFCLKGKCVCVHYVECVCITPVWVWDFSPQTFWDKEKLNSISILCVESYLRHSDFLHTISFLMCFSLVKETLLLSLFNHFILCSFFSVSFRFTDFNPTSPFFLYLLFDRSSGSFSTLWKHKAVAIFKSLYATCSISFEFALSNFGVYFSHMICFVCVWVCVVHSNSWQSSSCWAAVLQSGAMSSAITWLTS